MKLVALVTEPRNIARFLSALGEPTDVPARSPSVDAAAAVLEEHRCAPQGARERRIASRDAPPGPDQSPDGHVCPRHADAPRSALGAARTTLFRPRTEPSRRPRSHPFGLSRYTSSRCDPASSTYAHTQVAYPWPDDVSPRGDKEVWQTEMSGVKWWPEQGPSNTIENGVAIARWVHSAFVVGEANAWLWWWYSGNTTNEGLIQQSGSVTTKRYYTFGNFTRYIRPGYHRVAVTGVFPEKVLVSAYTNDSGKVVVVAINETTSAQTVPLAFAGGTAPSAIAPSSAAPQPPRPERLAPTLPTAPPRFARLLCATASPCLSPAPWAPASPARA
ncbi:glycoside hydrolase family 30 beta sandwich domain-containing protein [Sorangium sp. So ce1151]|uniref:glycoside hydrolase family 30 beta sandwich domain-containing protein n=1 Tax=Sorangium sp. So ce1151 TaxID=3133332 RepID=UPI003F629900